MKCLEKDRTRRYETANGLALDLRRYLADEPVLACPPSAGYRLKKFLRRNQGAGAGGQPGAPGTGGRHHWHDLGHDSPPDAQGVADRSRRNRKQAALTTALKSERDARSSCSWRCRTGPAPAASAGRWASAWTVSPLLPGPPASGPTSGCATRPSPRWPCPMSAACRAGAPRLPATTAMAYGGQYRLYARWTARAASASAASPTTGRSGASPRDQSSGTTCSSAPTSVSCSAWAKATRCACGAWPTGNRSSGTNSASCRAHAFSPDGRQLAVGQQGWVLCFDLATGKEVNRWRLPGTPHCLAFHPDSSKLAVGYLTPAMLPCTTRRAETCSRTCPWAP